MRLGSQASSVRRSRPPSLTYCCFPSGCVHGVCGHGGVHGRGVHAWGGVGGSAQPGVGLSQAGSPQGEQHLCTAPAVWTNSGWRTGEEPTRTSPSPSTHLPPSSRPSRPALETHAARTARNPTCPSRVSLAPGELGNRRGQWVPESFSAGLERHGAGVCCGCV